MEKEGHEAACCAARLAAAGAVGASVAHELRNALAVAESSLYLAQRVSRRRAPGGDRLGAGSTTDGRV